MIEARGHIGTEESSDLDYYCYLRTLDAEPVATSTPREVLAALRLQLRLLPREPVWVIVLVQLLLYALLLAPLLGRIAYPPAVPSGVAWHLAGCVSATVLAAVGLAVAVRTVQRAPA